VVLPVRRSDGSPAALKLSWLDHESRHEPVALRAWAGRGAVRLLDADLGAGVLLLERLDGGRTLQEVPDHEAATTVLADLLAELAAAPVPDGLPDDLPTVATTARRWAPRVDSQRGRLAALVGIDAVEAALATCDELGDDRTGWRLLHGDLHYANVLAGHRDGAPAWLAIDPKPLLGPPEWESVGPLWNRWSDLTASGDLARAVHRRLELLSERAGLHLGRARRYAQLRAIDELAWSLDRGLPLDPDGKHAALARILTG
jgi:streptomycin 6-kinase